ncbi:hypothetical protein RHMOL_Rhmol06G0130900 [Rhododendron molle]|uniref:Uncharacterized protein n=1 Tax=Rhododendron molle TaxID=49168 RepID=A0ACC0NE11_RHOML|nr:hypothetical protein RHMOL_Rhmol06G0130900 [Rhododendron molle]
MTHRIRRLRSTWPGQPSRGFFSMLCLIRHRRLAREPSVLRFGGRYGALGGMSPRSVRSPRWYVSEVSTEPSGALGNMSLGSVRRLQWYVSRVGMEPSVIWLGRSVRSPIYPGHYNSPSTSPDLLLVWEELTSSMTECSDVYQAPERCVDPHIRCSSISLVQLRETEARIGSVGSWARLQETETRKGSVGSWARLRKTEARRRHKRVPSVRGFGFGKSRHK